MNRRIFGWLRARKTRTSLKLEPWTHVTRHTSHVTHHTSHITHHTSLLPRLEQGALSPKLVVRHTTGERKRDAFDVVVKGFDLPHLQDGGDGGGGGGGGGGDDDGDDDDDDAGDDDDGV